MRKILMPTILFALLASASMSASPEPTMPSSQVSEGPVWYWFQNCPGNKSLGLEISRNGIVIFRSSFPICQMPRKDQEQKTLVFSFKGGPAYRAEYHTSPTEIIEGNIWLAGADPDALILGISFTTRKRILLNTLHVAKPDSKSVTEIDRGIVVRTFPLPIK